MRYGSVCSGIEAASVAWHPLGWNPAFFSEIDKAPRAVLAHRFPGVAIHDDFTTIKAGDYEPIDLLVGGTPCQSFSVAGKRAGLDDARGNLAVEFFRLAQRLRPKWIVWENVPGLLSSNKGRDFGALLAIVGECGYGWSYRVLDAVNAGVPQRRRRVFLVGHFGDWRPAAAVLFKPESLRWDTAPRGKTRKDVAGTLSSRTTAGGGLGTDFELGGGLVAPTPIDMRQASRGATMTNNRAKGASGGAPGTGIGAPGDPSPVISTSHTPAIAFSCKDHGADAGDVSPTLRSMGHDKSHMNGGGQVAVAFALRGREHGALPEINGDGDTIGALRAASGGSSRDYLAFKPSHYTRGKDGAPSDTVPPLSADADKGDQDPVVLVKTHVRRLTPVECERLQGFPDGWTDVPYGKGQMSDSARYKMIGNSMAVPVMRQIGKRIAMVQSVLKAKEMQNDAK